MLHADVQSRWTDSKSVASYRMFATYRYILFPFKFFHLYSLKCVK